jgi:hypothetical protein
MTRVFTDSYRGRAELTAGFWPPEGTFTGAPKIEAAVAEVRALTERAATAKAAAVEAGHAVERAEAADVKAGAEAVRANTRRPQPKRPAAEKAQAAAEHKAAVLMTAASDAANAALEVLDEHGPAFAAKLDARRTKLCEALLEALGKVSHLEEELGVVMALTNYLQASEVSAWRGSGKYGISRVPVPRTSDAPSFRVLVEALREAVSEKLPQPEQEPAPNVQPLRAHPMRGAA